MVMTNKAGWDDPMRSIGADATATFDWDSNPAEHADSEAWEAGTAVEDEEEEDEDEEDDEDEDEDEDEVDGEDEDGLPVIPRRVGFRSSSALGSRSMRAEGRGLGDGLRVSG
jgi:hypothetical protein